MVRSSVMGLALAGGVSWVLGTGVVLADTYLALGDSLAFGYSRLQQTPIGLGDNGYVRRYADHLAGVTGSRPEILNLAVPGETTRDFAGGPGLGVLFNTNYYDTNPFTEPVPSQAELLGRALNEHVAGTRTISTVTIHIGANDLFDVTDRPGFFNQSFAQQLLEAQARINEVAGFYGSLLGDIRSAAPGAEVFVMGYYNPFAILPSDPLFPVSDPAIMALNDALRGAALGAGAEFVDVFDRFDGREAELTRILTLDDRGEPNIHPTELGYDELAAALIAVPAPGSVAVLVIAGGVAARRRR